MKCSGSIGANGNRKAIQKAGYNMNELALSNSPSASPMVMRKTEPKCTVDWGETAVIGEHNWAQTSVTGDLCYVGESHCTKSGARKKCSACHIVVHESCMEQLDKIGFQCKLTFREASTRNLRENLIVRHHWVHRRRQEGKCKQCGKVFEKRFGFRDSKILAISCSWCKEAYHNKVSCFRMQKINEACTLGIHARIIIPPTWIVKWTPRGKSVRNRSKKKRSSGMWRKKSSREGRQKLFVIRPLPEHTPYLTPTIVFINPKSGGNQGVKILQTFQWLLNHRQVFNLAEGGPREALEMFRKVPNLRILACGGDGTVGWILSVLDEINMNRAPPVAILPLGTGNDLSRTLNWGAGYTDEPISKILLNVEEGKVVQLDRWKLTVQPNEEVKKNVEDGGNEYPGASTDGAVDVLPLDVVNNYFSLGDDARVSLEFHESREAHPGKFNSRFGNKFFYTRTGVTGYLTGKQKNIGKSVSVVCDGRDITGKIQALKPVCIVFLNIPRYSAGFMPWGHPTGSEFRPQMHDDKLIEVLAFTANQLGMMYVGGHGERLCQCREAVITTTRACPVQIDGEPCRLNPSIIRLSFLNQVNMLYKSKHRGSIPLPPDQPISEQQKICINLISTDQYEKHNGDKTQLRELSRPSHTTVVPADADLETVRLSIERTQQDPTHLKLSDQFTFLDLSGSDRFYRIDRTQEALNLVREVATSDGELFVLDVMPKSKVTKADLDSSLLLSRFPRSQQVDRATRKRFYSDNTNGIARQHSMPERQPLLTPGLVTTSLREDAETIPLKQWEQLSEQKKVSYEDKNKSDDVTKPAEDTNNDVTKDNSNKNNQAKIFAVDDKNTQMSNSEAVITAGELLNTSSGCLLSPDVKRNSLPSTLVSQDVKNIVKRRPLSCSSHDTDVIITDNSSKSPHCDITKAESFASVFSSPSSSKPDSLKNIQDPEHALWTSSNSASSTEYLVITEENDITPATMTSSPTSSPKSPSSPNKRSSSTASRISIDTSPSIEITDHDDELQIHENPSLDSLSVLSRKNNNRSSVSMIPSSKRQNQTSKISSNTATGMPLSMFVKTQSSPPTEKLISPSRKKTVNNRTRSPDANKHRSVTLNEFVSSLTDVPYNDEISTVTDGNLETTVPITMTTAERPISDQHNIACNVASVLATIPPEKRVNYDQISTDSEISVGGASLPINGIGESETVNDNQSNNHNKINKQYWDSSKRGDLLKLKMALESGADAADLDIEGSTVLHNAARFNNVEIVKFLIEEGPSQLLNMTDRDRQQTALHKAAWFGHKEVCELLVLAGASLALLDYKDMTPLDRARQADDVDLVQFLSQEAVKRMEDKETKL